MKKAIDARAIATHAVLVLLLGPATGACRPSAAPEPVPVVDFIKEFHRADSRPAGSFEVAAHLAGGTALPSIVGPAPSRIIWVLPVPRSSTFRAQIAAIGTPVRARIGVSDARIYEQLAEVTVEPGAGWSTLEADLSAYAGWKFSLFYRPDGRQWRLNLSVDAPAGILGRIAVGSPGIVASRADALEYAKRKARLTRNEAP
jgi:hypothetical protein